MDRITGRQAKRQNERQMPRATDTQNRKQRQTGKPLSLFSLLSDKPQFFFRPRVKSEVGKICFLTVQESLVEAGSTQRRPGLHVDCAGIIKLAGAEKGEGGGKGSGGKSGRRTKEGKEGDGESWRFDSHHWGLGGCQVQTFTLAIFIFDN